MEERHKKALTKNLVRITEDLDAHSVFNRLIEEEIFQDEDVENLEVIQPRSTRNRKLVETLKRKGPRAFDVFLEILKITHKHLYELLRTASLPPKDEWVTVVPFEGDGVRELSIQEGDILSDVVKHINGWSEGVKNGRSGFFPSNFVKKIRKKEAKNVHFESDKPGVEQPPCRPKTTSTGENVGSRNNKMKAKVTYRYEPAPENEDETNLVVGEIVEVLGEAPDDGWWKGIVRHRICVFPKNFVELIQDVHSSTGDEDFKVEACKCITAYRARDEDELSIEVGDVLTCLIKNSSGWWEGVKNGKSGIFPCQYVKEIGKVSFSRSACAGLLRDDRQEERTSVRAKVIHSYESEPEDEDEATLVEGEIVQILHKVKPGWYEGIVRGRRSMFPSSFVEVIQENSVPLGHRSRNPLWSPRSIGTSRNFERWG